MTATWPPGLIAFATRTGRTWAREYYRYGRASTPDHFFRRKINTATEPLVLMLRPEIAASYVQAVKEGAGNG